MSEEKNKLIHMLIDDKARFTNLKTGKEIVPTKEQIKKYQAKVKDLKEPKIEDETFNRIIRYYELPNQVIDSRYVRLNFDNEEDGYSLLKDSSGVRNFIDDLTHYICVEPGSGWLMPKYGLTSIHIDLDLNKISQDYTPIGEWKNDRVPQLQGFEKDFEAMLYPIAIIEPQGFPNGDDIWANSPEIFADRMAYASMFHMIGKKDQLERYLEPERYHNVEGFHRYKEELEKFVKIANPNYSS